MGSNKRIQFDENWFKHLDKLDPADQAKANKAIKLFTADTNHTSLNLEKYKNTKHDYWTIRAGKSIRIVLFKSGKDNLPSWTLLRAGTHDEIDQFINSSTPYYNAGTEQVGFVSHDTVGSVIENVDDEQKEKVVAKGIFSHWDLESLIEAGIPEECAELFLLCQTERDLLYSDVHHDVEPEVIFLAIDLLATTPAEYFENTLVESETNWEKVLEELGLQSGFSKFFTDEDELSQLLSGEIERWMVWLHPDQQAVVDANYAGPARIAGAAGTGKTSVALHRAKNLAQKLKQSTNQTFTAPRVAFITYNNNQPGVLSNLYARIPGTDVSDVEFITLFQLAAKILRGDPRVNIVNDIPFQFDHALEKIVTTNTPLDRGTGIRFGIDAKWRDYIYQEIESVIKGRQVASLEEYLEFDRTGRQQPLGKKQREQIWELYAQFQKELGRTGDITWTEQLQRAYNKLLRTGESLYDCVIIDEVQDISQIGLQMIRQAVNGSRGEDKPNGLLLVGDGAQRIYERFCSLQDAGINITGRSTILKKNYRNREEILQFALAVCKGQQFEDLGESGNREDSIDVFEFGEGKKPSMIITESRYAQDARICAEIRKLLGEGFTPSDIILVTRSRTEANNYRRTLSAENIPSQDIRAYNGRPSGKVSIGTLFMVKGLENKVVLIPDLSQGEFLPDPQGEDEPDDAYSERQDKLLNQFWVAATRARDRLIMSCVTAPSEWITDRAEGLFEYES